MDTPIGIQVKKEHTFNSTFESFALQKNKERAQ